MLTLNDGRSELWQWDTGRKLTVDADCSQVHFSNKVFGRSIDVDVVDGVAIIPDILLQTDKELNVWAFVGTAENGYTKIGKTFKVNRRNKPADYVFTPTDQTTLSELVERLDEIEESQDPDAIKNAVDEYLANNPIQVEEKDPTVPDWAKQPTKPKYTANEVGAVATVNGTAPDENGNVEIEIPEASEPDMTGYATERYVQENYQPKGNYLTEVPEGYAKTKDIPTKPEDIGAQPAGNYLTKVPSGYATEEFVKNKIAEAELSGEKVDLSGYAQKSELPTKVSQLENDKGYLTEHQDISGKLDADKLPEAVNDALAQAKASGEFKGDPGADGQPGKDGSDGSPGKDGKDGNGIKSAVLNADYTLRITFDDGTSYTTPSIRGATGESGSNGKDGDPGAPGEDGVGIASIKQTTTSTADGGNNVFTVTLTNGTSATFTVKNGSKGSTGDAGKDGTSATHSWNGTTLTVTSASGTSSANLKGDKGDKGDSIKGDPGSPGADGVSPTVAVSKSGKVTTISITDKNGTKTATVNDGADGASGSNGKDGHNPVRGTDYWTEADQEAIVQKTIQNIGSEIVPEYVVTEAMSVLDKVVSAQGSRTFVLGAITDMHYGSSDYIDGVIHACQGMHHIAKRIKLDALAVLGDYTDEHQMDTETALTDNEEMNALLDRFCDIDNLRLKGNHDHRPGADAQTYRYIMSYSDDVVWGSRIGGYFYRDFPAYKLRIICLNTTEVARDNVSVSDEQYNFFANALDMSAKEDSAEWGILILSHHPLDWTVTSGAYRFGHILNAYQNGNSWTDGTVSCNYADKNSAIIVGNIHGHIHNLLTDKIYVGEPGSSAQTTVWRMCVPASRVDYPNHYSGVWKESTTYGKTQNTADDTSFNIICIDLDSYTIKAFCYGAGYDREVTYYEKPQEIVNIIDTVGYTNDARYSASSHGTKSATGYVCTGAIQLAPGDVLRTSGVNFDAAEYNYCNVACIPNNNPTSDWTLVTNSGSMGDGGSYITITIDSENNLTITGGTRANDITIRLTGYGTGANLLVTKNQVI